MKKMTGTITNRYEEYGFIRGDNGTRYFFHKYAVISPLDYEDVREGQKVEFIEAEAPKGPKAIGVHVIGQSLPLEV